MKSFQHLVTGDHAESQTQIKTKNEKGTSLKMMTDAMLEEMKRLLKGDEEFDTLKTAVCSITDCIEIDTKNDVYKNIQDVLRIETLIINLKTSISEVRGTCSFLSTVLQKDQYLLKKIERMKDDDKRYSTAKLAKLWESAMQHEESLLKINKNLTQIKEDAFKIEVDKKVTKIDHFLKMLLSQSEQYIRVSNVEAALIATRIVNLYCRIATLYSYVLWQALCIMQECGYDTSATNKKIDWCHKSSLGMLACLEHPQVEHAVFLGVFHISMNENVDYHLKSLGIRTPVIDDSFYDKIHYIQWKYCLDVELHMEINNHCIVGIEGDNENGAFKFEPVRGREMDNLCYIRSANPEWKDHYIQMKSDGSCCIEKNKLDKGGKWKLVQVMIHNNPNFFITSFDYPGMFLYLESLKCKVKGEKKFDEVKEKGLWKIHEGY